MKRAFLVFCLVTAAFGADKLGQLEFLTPMKKFRATMGMNYTKSGYDTMSGAVKDSETDYYSFDILLDLRYGITNRLDFGVYFPFAVTSKLEDTQNGITTEKSSKGLYDPEFSARYRIFFQRKQSVNLDAVFKASWSFGDAELASTTEDGNMLRGGALYEPSIIVHRRGIMASWALGAGFQIFTDREYIDLSDSTQDEIDSALDLFFSAKLQYHMHQKFDLFAHLIFTLRDDRTYIDNPSGTSTAHEDTKVTTGKFGLIAYLKATTVGTLGFNIHKTSDHRVGTQTREDNTQYDFYGKMSFLF